MSEYTFEDKFRWAAGEFTDAIARVEYNGMKDKQDYWDMIECARELVWRAFQYAEDEGLFDDELFDEEEEAA